jgi:hypothetical protein
MRKKEHVAFAQCNQFSPAFARSCQMHRKALPFFGFQKFIRHGAKKRYSDSCLSGSRLIHATAFRM